MAGDDPRIRVAGERCERDTERHALTFDNQVMVVMRIAAPKPGIPCGLVLDLDGGGNSFDVLVDGKLHSTFWTNRWVYRRGRHTLVLSGGAADDGVGAVLTVTLVKRTEPKSVQLWLLFVARPATLHSVELSPGWDMLPPRLTPRRVEFVGDSDMAAFGVEGPPTPISLRGLLGVRDRHQNISSSWTHMLCRMLEAEPSVVAWSGVGAHQNAVMCQTPRIGDTVLPPRTAPALALTLYYSLQTTHEYARTTHALLTHYSHCTTHALLTSHSPRTPRAPGEYYGRALASRPGSRFEPADATEIPGGAREMPGDAWVPQLVLVEIGANDLHGGRAPPAQADFVRAYVALLRQVPCLLTDSRPRGLAALLPCYLAALLPCFLAASLPCCLAALLPCCRIASHCCGRCAPCAPRRP